MTLTLNNTLTRKKEPFAPLDDNNIRLYVCGPTVYDRAHLGNARSVVVYDVLYRTLCELYGKEHVTFVRNITDVDDKINARAKERGISIQDLTQEVTGWFHADMGALNTLPPTMEPRATTHIPQMITMIEQLIANGHAYESQGHVLFAVKTDEHYGCLSGRVTEDLQAGARVAVESYKRDAGDFVLWKPADADDDPSSIFDSPFGKGRPGWHIECSAMSTQYLGTDFDIHGGGSDLMFPHHENEIAQSTCANPGSSFARTWVHNGFLTVGGEKMSKSLGNFITVRDLLDRGVQGEVIRLALMMTKYNEPMDWTDKLIADAKKWLDALYRIISEARSEVIETDIPSEFLDALCNDLNTPAALASIIRIARSYPHPSEPHKTVIKYNQLIKMGALLGILQQDPEQWFKYSGAGEALDEDMIGEKIGERIAAKKARDFAKADAIRKELESLGVLLEDRPDGTTDWRRA